MILFIFLFNVFCLHPVPCIAIPQLAEQLAEIANRFYSDPSNIKVTGITGTNGKTTIAYQLAQAHHLLGRRLLYRYYRSGDVNH